MPNWSKILLLILVASPRIPYHYLARPIALVGGFILTSFPFYELQFEVPLFLLRRLKEWIVYFAGENAVVARYLQMPDS